jgi:peptide chain release factor 2
LILTDQLRSDAAELKGSLAELEAAVDIASLTAQLDELTAQSEQQGFWDDHEKASKLLKEKKSLETKLGGVRELRSAVEDLEVMIELAEDGDDEALFAEAEASVKDISKRLDAAKVASLLDGEHDADNAIVNIHGGAGGTDAQDWAEMLFRMYTRWAESKRYKVKLWDLQQADEGGIKGATFTVEGENAYGYLKNEKGVHRLVRISPFDSNARRHTSFAAVDVMPEIDDDIEVEINPDDIRVDTFRSSGAGGQHVNKTDSAIRITHKPTNIVVTCQNERSQHQNKEVAMRLLKSKLIELAEQEQKENLAELAGDYGQITWGNQIRSYVFQPYTMVKDHRTDAETGNVQAVMDGDIDLFINEKLKQR